MCRPIDRALVVTVARPAAFVGAVPSSVEPLRNVTRPVGAPAPGATALTVAVNASTWPNTAGFADGANVIDDAAFLMVSVSVADVVALKFPSPAYETLIA